MAVFESLSVRTPGATLAVRHFPGNSEPIVFLHGGPGMGDYFDSLPELLSPPYRAVTYDQRGCGRSSCDGSFEVDDQVADLDALRAYFGAGKLHLFGHSWGGLLGQLYAKAHPERVASLVLCCSMANTGGKVALMESKGIAERVIGRPKQSPVAWAAAGLLLQLPGKLGDLGYGYVMRQLMPHYVVRSETAPKAFDVNRTSKRAWRETNRSIKALGDDYLSQLTIDAPVLIVQGDQDVIRETNAVLAKRFPAAPDILIAQASHFPWLEQPDVFAGVMRDFYSKAFAPAA